VPEVVLVQQAAAPGEGHGERPAFGHDTDRAELAISGVKIVEPSGLIPSSSSVGTS
jgi:hypothetical protein